VDKSIIEHGVYFIISSIVIHLSPSGGLNILSSSLTSGSKTVAVVVLLFLSVIFLSSKAQMAIGYPVPEISLPGINGNNIQLSSFKGKVVLLDFWASWCGPCRASIPGVVKLYRKYKDKGFEVFGVSLDNKKSAWLKVIKKSKITYTQVMDSDGWNSATAARYGVAEIPTTFLLNRSGELVAVDMEGKDLELKIVELLQ